MKEQQKNYIVTLCYGYDRVFYEWSYALLTLSRLYTPKELERTEIWVYTDKPELFETLIPVCPLKLCFREIDNATLRWWRGKADFVHRVKIEALKDIADKKIGNIIYVDTDMVFTDRMDIMLQDINEGGLYMHLNEGKVNDGGFPVFEKLDKHLAATDKRINGLPLRDMSMWNAGVIGFNTMYAPMLDDVLAFVDKEYPEYQKHIMEQFGFSIYFQLTGNVKTADQYMYHYWDLKEAQVVLESFFAYFKNRSWADLVKYSTLIDIPAMAQAKHDFYNNRGILDKMLNSHWEPVIPDWAQLSKDM